MTYEPPAVIFNFDTRRFQVTVNTARDTPAELYEVAQKISTSEYLVTWTNNPAVEPLPAFTIDANDEDYLLWQIIDHIEEYEGSATYSMTSGEVRKGFPDNPEELMLKQLPR